MKNVKEILFLGVSLAFLLCIGLTTSPITVLAAITGPNECCLLTHDLNDVDPACDLNDIVGPTAGAKWCDTDGDGNPNALTANTINWGNCCFVDTVYTVSDWLFWLFVIMVVIIFVIASYFILFSGGSPQSLQTGKSFILYGVIALVLIALSKIIPSIVKTVVT